MKKLFLLTVFLFSLNTVSAYEVVDGTVLKVDLTKESIVMSVALPNGNAMSLKDLIDQVDGVAGVNATYFCPQKEAAYARCGNDGKSKFERFMNGTRYATYGDDTGGRGIIGVTKEGEAIFVQNNHGYVGDYKANTNSDRYDEIYNGAGNFPILLDNGKHVTHVSEADIDQKMRNKTNKNFICHTADKRYMYMGMVPNMTIYEVGPYIQEKYGCHSAINLDGGGSLAVHGNGKYLVGPGRDVVDAFVIVEKPKYRLTSVDHSIIQQLVDKKIPKSLIRSVLVKLKQETPLRERVIAILEATLEYTY